MKKKRLQKNNGFTIIEALVAIFILSVSVATMLAITGASEASARFANNEITANYLLQEAIDSVRNSRDSLAFQNKDTGIGGWDKFLQRYNSCFSGFGCDISMEDFNPNDINGSDVISCGESCLPLYYDTDMTRLFYNHSRGVESPFVRTINMKKMDPDNSDEIEVKAKVEWYNGDNTNKRSQTLTIYLLNWQK